MQIGKYSFPDELYAFLPAAIAHSIFFFFMEKGFLFFFSSPQNIACNTNTASSLRYPNVNISRSFFLKSLVQVLKLHYILGKGKCLFMSTTKMNKGLTIFGIVVFILGLFCVFWRERKYSYSDWEFPFREIGIVLTAIGIVLIAIGLVLPRKT